MVGKVCLYTFIELSVSEFCAMSEDNKDVSLESVLAEEGVETTPGHEELKKGTQRDQRDMVRMGMQ